MEVFNIYNKFFWTFQKMKKEKKEIYDLLGGGVVEAEGAELLAPWPDDALNWALRVGMHGTIGVSGAKKGTMSNHSKSR